jgi:cytochrome P450
MYVDAPLTIARHSEVRAVLADPRFVVPAAPALVNGDTPVCAGAAGVAWLRARVARFSTGTDHERRRGLAIGALTTVDAATLGRQARERTETVLAAGAGRPVDVMTRLAREIPLGVLAGALGVAGPVASDVAVVADAYPPEADAGPAADRAVARLVESFGGIPDEATAARIGLLVQACHAVAGLIGNCVLATARGQYPQPTAAIVAETLRHDPPVRSTRRVCRNAAQVGSVRIAAGTVVRLDLAGANRDPEVFRDPDLFDPGRPERERHLTFGAGLRPCPGGDHAFAIVVGVMRALHGCRLVDAEVSRDPSATLRVPARVVVDQG